MQENRICNRSGFGRRGFGKDSKDFDFLIRDLGFEDEKNSYWKNSTLSATSIKSDQISRILDNRTRIPVIL